MVPNCAESRSLNGICCFLSQAHPYCVKISWAFSSTVSSWSPQCCMGEHRTLIQIFQTHFFLSLKQITTLRTESDGECSRQAYTQVSHSIGPNIYRYESHLQPSDLLKPCRRQAAARTAAGSSITAMYCVRERGTSSASQPYVSAHIQEASFRSSPINQSRLDYLRASGSPMPC